MRQIIMDTETTGFKPGDGHRIVEIAGIEMINGQKTGRFIHFYINPERDIPPDAVKIHGITNEFVQGKPIFAQIAKEVAEFIKGAEIIAHNAKFDTDFMNHEFQLAGIGRLWDYTSKVTDSLFLSRSIDAEESRHSLDAICKRYDISTEGREYHGALLDSELLCEAYLKLTKGQTDLDIKDKVEQSNWVRPEIKRFNAPQLKVAQISDMERLAELKMSELIAKSSKNKVAAEEAKVAIVALEKKLGLYVEPVKTPETKSTVAPVPKVSNAPALNTKATQPAPNPQEVENNQTVAPIAKPRVGNSFSFLKR